MILTISGLHGTGKSEVAKRIADALQIKFYSTGQAFRDLAKEMSISLEEFTVYVETHPEIDKKLDEKIIKIAKKDNVIVDSQLSGYLLNNISDFKILLTCPLKTRIKRMMERDQTAFEEKLKETLLREKSERKRFKDLYHIDLSDKIRAEKIYDLIIKTENLSIEEVVNKILASLEKI